MASDLRARIEAIHQPTTESAESYPWNNDHHDAMWPDCPGVDDASDCPGHEHDVQVCGECGYEHDGDQATFRRWPCPTIEALAAPVPTVEEKP